MKRRIRIQGFLIFLFFTLSILLSKSLFPHWEKEAPDEFLDAVGIGTVLFGFLFRISARGYKAEKSWDGKKLITDGPYGLMRHPMYFGTFLIGLGIIFVLFNWWVFPLFFFVFLLIYIPQIHREEQKLQQQFDDEYMIYCKKTPKYFPRVSIFFKLDFRDYLPLKWLWIKKELISLTVVISVMIAIEIWEDVRLFGYAERTKELLESLLIIIPYFAILLLLINEANFKENN